MDELVVRDGDTGAFRLRVSNLQVRRASRKSVEPYGTEDNNVDAADHIRLPRGPNTPAACCSVSERRRRRRTLRRYRPKPRLGETGRDRRSSDAQWWSVCR